VHLDTKALLRIDTLLVAAIAIAASETVLAAESNLGRDIAANCAACHGTAGRSRGGLPSLAGRDKATIVKQIQEFRDGTRPSTIMQQIAKGYTDAQLEAAAAYFAAQRPD